MPYKRKRRDEEFQSLGTLLDQAQAVYDTLVEANSIDDEISQKYKNTCLADIFHNAELRYVWVGVLKSSTAGPVTANAGNTANGNDNTSANVYAGRGRDDRVILQDYQGKFVVERSMIWFELADKKSVAAWIEERECLLEELLRLQQSGHVTVAELSYMTQDYGLFSIALDFAATLVSHLIASRYRPVTMPPLIKTNLHDAVDRMNARNAAIKAGAEIVSRLQSYQHQVTITTVSYAAQYLYHNIPIIENTFKTIVTAEMCGKMLHDFHCRDHVKYDHGIDTWLVPYKADGSWLKTWYRDYGQTQPFLMNQKDALSSLSVSWDQLETLKNMTLLVKSAQGDRYTDFAVAQALFPNLSSPFQPTAATTSFGYHCAGAPLYNVHYYKQMSLIDRYKAAPPPAPLNWDPPQLPEIPNDLRLEHTMEMVRTVIREICGGVDIRTDQELVPETALRYHSALYLVTVDEITYTVRRYSKLLGSTGDQAKNYRKIMFKQIEASLNRLEKYADAGYLDTTVENSGYEKAYLDWRFRKLCSLIQAACDYRNANRPQ